MERGAAFCATCYSIARGRGGASRTTLKGNKINIQWFLPLAGRGAGGVQQSEPCLPSSLSHVAVSRCLMVARLIRTTLLFGDDSFVRRLEMNPRPFYPVNLPHDLICVLMPAALFFLLGEHAGGRGRAQDDRHDRPGQSASRPLRSRSVDCFVHGDTAILCIVQSASFVLSLHIEHICVAPVFVATIDCRFDIRRHCHLSRLPDFASPTGGASKRRRERLKHVESVCGAHPAVLSFVLELFYREIREPGVFLLQSCLPLCLDAGTHVHVYLNYRLVQLSPEMWLCRPCLLETKQPRSIQSNTNTTDVPVFFAFPFWCCFSSRTST